MATQRPNHDKEISLLLNRIHSGCRFVNFQEATGSSVSSSKHQQGISNYLRNASPPDECHAELGRALGHSYVASLFSAEAVISEYVTSGAKTDKIDTIIERGARIVHELCCGESVLGDKNINRKSLGFDSNQLNYASAASAFFQYLQAFCFKGTGENRTDIIKSIILFTIKQWQKWCIQCEEFAFASSDSSESFSHEGNSGGGGIDVLRACLKGFALICPHDYNVILCNVSTDLEDESEKPFVKKCDICDSLKHTNSRKFWIRARVHHASNFVTRRGVLAKSGDEMLVQSSSLVEVLDPLFQSCILQLSRRNDKRHLSSLDSHHSEKELLVRETLWGCSNVMHNINGTGNEPIDSQKDIVSCIASMIQYLCVALSTYIRQVVSVYCAQQIQNKAEEAVKVLELSYEWLRGVCQLMQTILTKIIDLQIISRNPLAEGIDVIVTTILPQLSSSLSSFPFDFDLAGIYSSLVSCITSLKRHEKLMMANETVAIRLGTLALNLQDNTEIELVCGVMLSIFGLIDDTIEDFEVEDLFMIGGVLCSLGCVFSPRPMCAETSSRMKLLGASILRQIGMSPHDEERNDYFFSHGGKSHLFNMIAASLRKNDCSRVEGSSGIILSSICNEQSVPMFDWERRELPLADQSTGLLLGLSLLHGCVTSKSNTNVLQPRQVYSFIGSLLKLYPRMASRTVPSIIHVLRTCMDPSAGYDCIESTLLVSLEFLASESIISDPHGAHLVWKYVSSLTDDGVPTAVRSSFIRILAKMCGSNKKLFRRIRDVIGRSMVSRDPIIRIAATATLADLAKFDLLRDVEEIIGWVQIRLQDEEPAVAHFALVTLKYLVVNEELEFDLVIRVLEKRLGVDLCDTPTIMKLDSLIQEGLLMLLGAGRLEEYHGESESEEDNDIVPIVSPELSKAVSLLLDCHQYLQNVDKDICSKAIIRRRIYASLGEYTPQILGLDPDVMRDWDGFSDSKDALPEVTRFLALKSISVHGLDFAAQLLKSHDVGMSNNAKDVAKDILHSVSKLFRTLLLFEDEVHGSFLFRGSSIRNPNVGPSMKSEGRVSKAGISQLPDAADVKKMFEEDPRSASAIAFLYAMGSTGSDSSTSQTTSELVLQISECFYDLLNEPLVDPAFQAVQTCSMIYSMDVVWTSMEQAEESTKHTLFNQVVSDVESWASNSGEYAYVALAALALAVDDDPQLCSFITKIQNTILGGSDNYLFASEDARMLCVGMVAAKLSRTADARVSDLIDVIQLSLSDNSKACFGAFFGMGLMVKNLASRSELSGSNPSKVWRCRTIQRLLGIFMTEFDACLSESNATVRELVDCLKMGESSDDLLSMCEKIDLSIQVGVDLKFKSILIGLAHTFFALSTINAKLMKCVAFILIKLPWGSGKGFVIHNAYKACLDTEMFQQEDLLNAILDCSDVLRKAIADGSDLICSDALFALASLCSLSTANVQAETSLVVETIQKVLSDISFGNDCKSNSALAGCAIVGQVPGLTSFAPLAHQLVKKEVSLSVVKVLNETAYNDSEEVKCRDSATIGLGVLCAMKSSIRRVRKNRLALEKTKQIDRGVDIGAIIQARDGSVLESILHEIQALLRMKSQHSHEDAAATNNRLSVLFSSLELIAMPGSFSRVIEIALSITSRKEAEVKTSSVSLLISQLKSRRRIGFDGRGFVDLSTRLAKMPYRELTDLIGVGSLPIITKAISDLLYQLPTSVCEGVLKNLWTLSQDEIVHNASISSTEAFLLGLKRIMLDAVKNDPGSKRTISPALLRALQKATIGYIFSDLCKNASPSNPACMLNSENIWSSYIRCLEMIPAAIISESDVLKSEINHGNIYGIALCAPVLSSMSGSSASYRTRKIETFIACQNYPGNSNNDIRVIDQVRAVLLASLVIAPQRQSETEMKESIMNIFESMLVQGVETFGLELLAIKVAFWWESLHVNERSSMNVPVQRVTKLSSFLIAKNICFQFQSLPYDVLIQFYDACIADLPFKLALLCGRWRISEDVSNRAKRICNDGIRVRATKPKIEARRLENALFCLRDIVQLITGEMLF